VLRLRSGLYSGPVTTSILRGEKSRFQLFNDTMNTASTMESTRVLPDGTIKHIQTSSELNYDSDTLAMKNLGHWQIHDYPGI